MAGLNIKINRVALEERMTEILGKNPRYLLNHAREHAEEQLEEVRNDVLSEFDDHRVTKELRQGNRAITSVLPYGNLFSFIGFDAGFSPTTNLRILIKNGIRLTGTYDYNRRLKRYYFRVVRPSRMQVEDETVDDVEWAINSGSWVFAIEEGISGLNHYFFKSRTAQLPRSRSGPALQSKNVVSPGADFSGTPYLGEIWRFLENRLRGPVI